MSRRSVNLSSVKKYNLDGQGLWRHLPNVSRSLVARFDASTFSAKALTHDERGPPYLEALESLM